MKVLSLIFLLVAPFVLADTQSDDTSVTDYTVSTITDDAAYAALVASIKKLVEDSVKSGTVKICSNPDNNNSTVPASPSDDDDDSPKDIITAFLEGLIEVVIDGVKSGLIPQCTSSA